MGGTHSRKRIDITGQRYGRLVALRPAENIGSRTTWLCRCDCGRECVVKTVHLRSGHVTSCGCAKVEHDARISSGDTESLVLGMLQSDTVRSNNTSGVTGVDWRKNKRRWRATICFKGTRRYLGSFVRFEDAVAAREKAEEELRELYGDAAVSGSKRK